MRPVGRMGQRLDILLRVGADMKIREGAYYRTRDGDVVGPMLRTTDQSWYSNYRIWNEDGGIFSSDAEPGVMLISEVYVSDTPPEAAPAPEAKTLRDEFASEAMKKLMDTSGLKAAAHHDEANRIGLGKLSYGIADAMMEARKK
jgi:hypothetical protein